MKATARTLQACNRCFDEDGKVVDYRDCREHNPIARIAETDEEVA